MHRIMSGSIRRRRLMRRAPNFQAAIVAVLLCAVQAGAQNPGPTKWTNTNGGVWSDGTSWSNGVPNSNDVWLTLTGVSYTNTYDAPINDFRDLTISNSAGYTSTLNIASTAFAPVGNVLLSSGAVVNVNAGGVWKPTIGTNANVSIEVKAGSVLNIAGGSIIYSNMPPTNDVSLILSDSSANGTSVLNLTSGQLELDVATNYSSSVAVLSLGAVANKSGIMNISGGKCTFQSGGHNSAIHIGSGAGGCGYLYISGGELVITNSPGYSAEGAYVDVGVGSGGYGEINISGAGKFTKANTKEFWVGNNGEGHINVNGGTFSNAGNLSIGYRGINSTGIVEIIAGELLIKAHLYLGAEPYVANRDDTGILNVYGGKVAIDGGVWAGQSSAGSTNRIGRITVTNGLLIMKQTFTVSEVTGIGKANGELNLSDSGIISNMSTLLYVGNVTNAVGVFNQTGGRYQQNSGVMYVGNNGGDGKFKMSGSQGALNVAALTATTSTSRISFDLGPNGAGTVAVSGAVSISTNTSLEIIVTNYDWLAHGLTVDLISYGTLTGTFGATNVTIIGAVGGLDGGSITYGSGTSDKIRLQLNRRPSGTIFYMR